MIVTFEQAKKLKAIGYNLPTRSYYEANGCLITQEESRFILAPKCNTELSTEYSAMTISDALQWTRKNKEIVCSVKVAMVFRNTYNFEWYDNSDATDTMGSNGFGNVQLLYPEAEAALLDKVLGYLEGTFIEK